MIKKPTLIILLCAVALGAGVYYFDWKKGNQEKPPANASNPAFTMQASDVARLTISHPAEPSDAPIRIEKRSGGWRIVQPLDTDADESTIEGIADQIAGAQIGQTEPGTPDRLKVYGLAPAQISLEFQLASGAKHTILIGNKDFSGDSVYAIVDGAQNVALLPGLLATSAGKALDDLRDRTVLRVDAARAASFSIKSA